VASNAIESSQRHPHEAIVDEARRQLDRGPIFRQVAGRICTNAIRAPGHDAMEAATEVKQLMTTSSAGIA
jgi:hypothetical protein